MTDQMDLFSCDDHDGNADLCWRMQTYLRCTGRPTLHNTSDYGKWIGQRWVEFYIAHPARARRAGESEHQWFPRMLDNQDVFDDWLRARVEAGERPKTRLPKISKPYYEHIADVIAAAGRHPKARGECAP